MNDPVFRPKLAGEGYQLSTPQGPWSLRHPALMGILNLNSDSFYAASRFTTVRSALAQAEKLLEEGADILDLGGESTRPGAQPIPASVEAERVLPVIQAIKQRFACRLSIDTRHASTMQAAIDLGVDLVNDVQALQGPGALETVASSNVALCLMHMRGTPDAMQQGDLRYPQDDPMAAVIDHLRARVEACLEAGIAPDRLILDPGIGFGKAWLDNHRLVHDLPRLVALGYPVLISTSRKTFLKGPLELPPEARGLPTALTSAWAVQQGACLVRDYDMHAQTVTLACLYDHQRAAP